VQALSKRFPAKPPKPVLHGISAKFPTGQVSVIVGNNGSGKSTLLNCVLGLLPFEEGTIKVDNDGVQYDIQPETLNAIPIQVRQKIGYIFQHKALWQHLTVLDNLIHPLSKIRKKTASEALDKAKEYFDLLELKAEHFNKYPNELSGGEQRKVAIARTLAMEPELLFIDELEANLDHSALKLTLRILEKQFVDQKKTIVIVSHNLEMLEPFVPFVSILHQGQIIETGMGIGELLSKECSSAEMSKAIRDSVDNSTSKWFVVSRGLETAVKISEMNLAEPDLSKLLIDIGRTIARLIRSYDPTGEHLLLISTKIAIDHSSSDVRIRCTEKTEGFILDGQEVPKLSTLVNVTGYQDGRNVYGLAADYVQQLVGDQPITLKKKDHFQQHYSLIDRFFEKNGEGLFYQFTTRHPVITGAYRIAIPIDERRRDEKNSYYEFSTTTQNVYLIGCSVDGEVKGVISIDTNSPLPWSDFMVQQLVLLGNMVAIAIKNHDRAFTSPESNGNPAPPDSGTEDRPKGPA
jgi:ABC-type polar amino acid transport system ATPase subunit